ncbi:MAG: OmpA family protein [Thermodesulfobacteriota bacterium]
MKSRFFTIVNPLLVIAVFFFSITPAFSSTPLVYDSNELTNRLKTGAYLQKTDNLMIIVDGLGETFLGVGEPRNQKIARFLISNMGKTIPNIPHRRMLRIHGPKAERFEKDFSTIFGLYHTDAKGFTPIIATKTHAISDFDPLGLAFISATKDLRKLSGSHAVVLISDGVNIPKSAIYESAYMKKKFRGSVCYYPILIGNDPQGAKNMSSIAKVGGCGFLAQYEGVDSPAELNDYVEKIFFAKRRVPVKPVAPVAVAEPETTTDQTPDEEQVLTDTEIVEEPAIADVIEDQYAVEEIPAVDGDIIILERQLPHDKVVTIELHVEFDLNKASLRTGYEEEIREVADFMLLYPETEALLEGHTCDLGSAPYNLQLSKRRAATIKNYLVKNFSIDPDRLKIRGAGESEPIADNSTEAGRMKNRRVMAVISTIVTDYVVVEQELLKSDFLSDDFILPPVDQVVDEVMQQEIVEEPQEEETSESTEETISSEADPMATEEPAEMPTEAEPTEIPVVESAVEEDSQTTSEEVVEGEVSPTEEVVEDTMDKSAVQESGESAADEAFDLKKQPAEDTAAPVTAEKEPALVEPPKEAAPQKAPSDDVVVVSPGESAFDDKGIPAQVEETEEVAPAPSQEEKDDTVSPEKVKLGEDDSFL